ncbi:MAG: Putative oxidoreductase, partial [uncultured Gemmatimonadetes bacterium]
GGSAGCGGERNVPGGRRHPGAPAGLRRHADHGGGGLGPAEGPRGVHSRAEAHRGTRCEPDRHGGFLRAQRKRGADRRGAVPVSARAADRHQGRLHALRAGQVDGERASKAPPRRLRGKPPAAAAGHHRPVAASPHRPRHPRRGPGGHRGRPAARGKDPPRGAVGGDGGADRGRAARGAHRHGAEPLQRGGPRMGGRAGQLRARGDRLHPLVPAGGRQAGGRGWSACRGGAPARRGRVAGGAGLAAAALRGDAAHPGHLQGRAPGRERRRRRGGAGGRRVPPHRRGRGRRL